MVNCRNNFFSLLLIAIGMLIPFSQTMAQTGKKIVVAIDAGHGGKDPGALGQNGLKEKDVNFAVAKKLQKLLQKDPLFEAVLTRTGDYFISVSSRSDIARTKNANFLVSIHADAAQNANATGASVWVISNKRADSELGRWLEQQDKQSELLGGGGNALGHGNDNPYLSQAVIDLQFAHSQRVGYDVAVKVLGLLDGVGRLHKNKPEHVSFGVLRSPDIPSILVEVGFISNKNEEKLLATPAYQDKLANAIYRGIRGYFIDNPPQSSQSLGGVNLTGTAKSKHNASGAALKSVHVVKNDETLFSIARQYKISVAHLREQNQLKNDTIFIGQALNVTAATNVRAVTQPSNSAKSATTRNSVAKKSAKAKKYTVVAGDSLSVIAQKNHVTVGELRTLNQLTSDTVKVGQVLTLP